MVCLSRLKFKFEGPSHNGFPGPRAILSTPVPVLSTVTTILENSMSPVPAAVVRQILSTVLNRPFVLPVDCSRYTATIQILGVRQCHI